MFSNKVKTKTRSSLMAIGALSLIVAMPAAYAATTTYNVTETFNQVVYNTNHPTWDTIFTGSFTFDTVSQTVTNLTGSLSQAMTGNTALRQLSYQKSSVYDSDLGGWLVSSFYQDSTDVFQSGGFATGGMKEFGNQNAYATIFVNILNPTAALTSAQIGKLAYGDCTTGSLMGMGMGAKTCMTGYINPATGLQGGTMMGTYPITQSITAVPEPETYAMLMAGLGLMGFIARRRQTS